ncbi:hypothetical protein TrST_g2959 [Triparma strigata]|uniref:Glutathione S-transferase n=2 Tax=Triparma TaxID=722752 RepID=A0A9W7B3Q4_9STRA|nr:hypothetical protein TrST_g2959 [Triparma strigata]
MEPLKLTYFEFQGPAEAIRLALTIGKIPFTDEVIPFETWKTSKPLASPWGQLPYLTLPSGEVFGQSHAMLTYVGRLTSLLPPSPLEALTCESFVQYINQDLRDRKISSTMRIKNDAEKIEARKQLNDFTLPEMLDSLISKIPSSGYVCLGRLTVADLSLYTFLNWVGSNVLDGIDGRRIIKERERLVVFMEMMEGVEGVREWNLEKRKGKLPIDFRS